MPKTWTDRLVVSAAALMLAACATTKEELLPHNSESTMLDIWNVQTGGAAGSPFARQLLDARQSLRRPLSEGEPQVELQGYTRTAQNEIDRQFSRLPNPDLVMYVFPHLAGTEQVPVPGYSTVFPLHQRVQYALPGERIEDY